MPKPLEIARNSSLSPQTRRAAWDTFEREAWYQAVTQERLRLTDIPYEHRSAVHQMLLKSGVQVQPHNPLGVPA